MEGKSRIKEYTLLGSVALLLPIYASGECISEECRQVLKIDDEPTVMRYMASTPVVMSSVSTSATVNYNNDYKLVDIIKNI